MLVTQQNTDHTTRAASPGYIHCFDPPILTYAKCAALYLLLLILLLASQNSSPPTYRQPPPGYLPSEPLVTGALLRCGLLRLLPGMGMDFRSILLPCLHCYCRFRTGPHPPPEIPTTNTIIFPPPPKSPTTDHTLFYSTQNLSENPRIFLISGIGLVSI